MITLSSDFGWPYPAAMRGTIMQLTDARLINICHSFPRGDVRTAGFWLREILPHFPPAVHLAVVDPGVGGDRDVLVITADEHVLVGPDNGLLVPAARRLGEQVESYVLAEYDAASHTFHGRDVFAPLAARIHEQNDVGAIPDLASTSAPVDLQFPDPVYAGSDVRGEVLVIDGFGNVITNIPGEAITDHFADCVVVNGMSIPAVSHYAAVDRGAPLVTVGSTGLVELAVNDGRGDVVFELDVGDDVVITT